MRLIVLGLLRVSAVTVALLLAFYLLPLDDLAGVPLAVSLAAGLLALTAMTTYQVRAIIRARYQQSPPEETESPLSTESQTALRRRIASKITQGINGHD